MTDELSIKYEDPPNMEHFIEKLNTLREEDEFRKYIDSVFPGWLIGVTKNYSSDYAHLQGNWIKVCHLIGVKPASVLFVDWISFDEKHKLIQVLCELLTRRGFVVRRKEEFVGCSVCGSAIPDKKIWEGMKKTGLKVPDEWSAKCTNC